MAATQTPKKILVVEDDRFTRKVICDILKSAGYEVLSAGEASTAVKLAREENPDLITLDVVLDIDSPSDSLNGFGVATWLERLNQNCAIPIIVISGVDPGMVVEGASAVNAYTFLPKPVEKASLLAAVANALK